MYLRVSVLAAIAAVSLHESPGAQAFMPTVAPLGSASDLIRIQAPEPAKQDEQKPAEETAPAPAEKDAGKDAEGQGQPPKASEAVKTEEPQGAPKPGAADRAEPAPQKPEPKQDEAVKPAEAAKTEAPADRRKSGERPRPERAGQQQPEPKQDEAAKPSEAVKTEAPAVAPKPDQPSTAPEKTEAASEKKADEKSPATEAPPAAAQRTQDRRDAERGRARPDGDRPRERAGDGRRRDERNARDAERQETTSKELSRTKVRDGQRAVIDGGVRVIIREQGRAYIRHDDERRFRGRGSERRVETLPGGGTRAIVSLAGGGELITVRDRDGNIIRRVRRTPDGRRIVLIDNRDRGPRPLAELNLGPLRITIPRDRYIVDSREANGRRLQETLAAPPVERVEREYTLEEIRRYERVRDKMRRVDVSTINFDLDSAEITPDQVAKLEALASTIRAILKDRPDEVFLIEGHTDASGTDIHNLALSDRRAEAVAYALSEAFDVPPENLVTQGYGEAHLKIATEEPERENRRVAVRRITPLLRGADAGRRQ